MEKLFRLKKFKTDAKTEIAAGFTVFFTMAYIIFVNPSILALAGMDRGGVFIATCLSAALGTFLMAFLANLPYAQAPGMGLNAFFAYTICLGMGFHWKEALAMVFICGIIGVVLTATNIRRSLLVSIPESLQNAIAGGIGLFIAYIGVKNSGLIAFSDTAEGITAGAQAVPRLAPLTSPGVLLAIIGLVIISVLMIYKVRAAILIGIAAAALIGIPMGVTVISTGAVVNTSALSGFKEVSFSFFGDTGIFSLFTSPARAFSAISAVLALMLTDVYCTLGAFIAMGSQSGILDNREIEILKSGKGFKSRLERGLFADMLATIAGALFGTSNVTTYIESAAGVSIGGRTGFSALITGILFLLCIPFASAIAVVPIEATAPALIIVGVLMMSAFNNVKWSDFSESLPAFMTVIVMVFGYSIADGIAVGFVFYCIVKICNKEYRDLHPILVGSAVLFIINFILILS